jgi:hypothetical protein
MRYASLEKLCLALYYACNKFRHYVLANTCVVVSQYDVIKSLLPNPIFSWQMGKWTHALVEYDLTFGSLQATQKSGDSRFCFRPYPWSG